jgi:hypothetical protein
MISNRRILGASAGGFGAGLLLLVGGLIVKHSQAKMLAVCSSGPGQFGQALNPSTARQCGSAHDLSSMASGAIWIGAFLLVVAAGGCIAFLAMGITASKKPKVVVPAGGMARSAGPGQAAPAPARAGEGAVLRPIVPVTVGEPVAAGHAGGLPGPGCGHGADDGARFCTVCGSPAAGGRDVPAAGQPVSVTGSEITTVLPVFAPPEPVGVPAPAMATDRSAERSMAGVGPASQLSWADRPPAPGGVDSSPPWSWADQPTAPRAVTSGPPWEQAGSSSAGGAVASSPPWEQAGSSSAGGAVASSPPWEQAGSSSAAGVVASGAPWEQAGSSSAPGAVKSGPPWDWAEPSPAPGGTGPGAEGTVAHQSGSGRHRSRRA